VAKTDPAIATSVTGATDATDAASGFDVHERPTSPKAGPGTLARAPKQDAAATTRMKAYELETLVRKESGTRRVVTADQIKRFVRERETLDHASLERATIDRSTMPMPQAPPRLLDGPTSPGATDLLPVDVHSPTLSHVPMLPFPRSIGAALASVDRRWFTIALIFTVAVVSALAGFVAARLEF
jgi:hypothetical protein